MNAQFLSYVIREATSCFASRYVSKNLEKRFCKNVFRGTYFQLTKHSCSMRYLSRTHVVTERRK